MARIACSEGRLDRLTVPLLKGFCKKQGLRVGGKKAELLARVGAFLEARSSLADE